MSNWTIFITPLINRTTYGTEVEVTDRVDLSSSSIKAGIDKEDFDVGSYLFDVMTLNMMNEDGSYSDQEDVRSMFRYMRDSAKVRVVFNDSGDGTATTMFRGLIDELGTVDDIPNSMAKLSVLSQDSVLRKIQVAAGLVSNGTLISVAIVTLLSVSEVTTTLSFNPANVSVGLDQAIDDGTFFDNANYRDALDALLVASGSVLFVDATGNIIVKPRTANAITARALYGPQAATGAENILAIKQLKSGWAKMYNAVTVNGVTTSDTFYQSQYLSQIKDLSIQFMTDVAKQTLVSRFYVTTFKAPKPELSIEVSLQVCKSWGFFDPVTLDYPLRRSPAPGANHLPLFGQAKFGADKFPYVRGAYSVGPNVVWALLAFEIKLSSLSSTLRLTRSY